MSKSLFISKNEAELEELHAFTDSNEMTLVSHSFLEFKPISFTLTDSFDVIFFGSPRAVMFFKAQQDLSKNAIIACVGSKTKSLLESLGHHVAFSGEESRSIKEVSEDFKNWLDDRKVLFPVSTRSLGTISKKIPSRQKVLVECYQTSIVSKEIPPCNYYVFTSPSNVEGFFQKNTLPEVSCIIAWGTSTAESIRKMDVACDTTLETPSIESLILYLEKIRA